MKQNQLEAQSIEIIREAVATSKNPVMMYSIGKDSSVMLHLARKAFWPATPPFPLLHVDTTWKFREMIVFRDQMVKDCGMELRVHTNEAAKQEGISPFVHGSERYTDRMKTEALKQALDAGGYPLTAAIESDATTLQAIIEETLAARSSERQGRLIDHDGAGSMERKKQEGYF